MGYLQSVSLNDKCILRKSSHEQLVRMRKKFTNGTSDIKLTEYTVMEIFDVQDYHNILRV